MAVLLIGAFEFWRSAEGVFFDGILFNKFHDLVNTGVPEETWP